MKSRAVRDGTSRRTVCSGASRVRVIAGNEVHISAVGALRYLGFGSEEIELVPVDDQGRMRADALDVMLGKSHGPTIVCTQAGNVSTGASDPFAQIISSVHARGAWVRVRPLGSRRSGAAIPSDGDRAALLAFLGSL